MGEPSSAAPPQGFACSPAVALTRAKPDAGVKPCKFSGGEQGGRQLGWGRGGNYVRTQTLRKEKFQ